MNMVAVEGLELDEGQAAVEDLGQRAAGGDDELAVQLLSVLQSDLHRDRPFGPVALATLEHAIPLR
jgi:hypothetical protein